MRLAPSALRLGGVGKERGAFIHKCACASTPARWRTCRACYGVLRFVMESGAKGCEVIVSGKLRAARAKSMKFKDGYMVGAAAAPLTPAGSCFVHTRGGVPCRVPAGGFGGWVAALRLDRCGLEAGPCTWTGLVDQRSSDWERQAELCHRARTTAQSVSQEQCVG